MMKHKDIVEELYRCFRQQDVECFKQLCSPSIIWQQNSGFPGEGTHQGPTAVLNKVYKAFNIEWKRWSFVIERVLDAGDDIVVLGYFSGSKRDNNERFKLAASHIYSFRDGKVIKFQQFTDEQVSASGAELQIA
ncbi:MAG: ketosteroid isomerase-like protein [Oleispira sp.]|jgi:ketosteroid isomerase-like protein